jgi:exodeoxyribonuclease-3
MGLPHIKIMGQKGWHGVAIASRLPLEEAPVLNACREGHARCVSAKVAGVEIHNFYIPAGGDTPDRATNAKFDHKLDFYETLTAEMKKRDPKAPLILTGDLNVAPGENDVWSHRQMSKVVSHTPIELEAFEGLMKSIDFLDLPRLATPEPEKLFSWWSYRAANFRKSNRGLRLDHILASPGLRDAAIIDGKVSSKVHDTVREWERPSDHAPVTADLLV